MMKDNIVTIDWSDEILASTALTHAGRLCDSAAKDGDTANLPSTHPAAKAA